MRTYLIHGDQITALAARPKALDADSILIKTIDDFDADRFPMTRLVALWNALPGASPVKRFTSRAAGVDRLWSAMRGLSLASDTFCDTPNPTSKQMQVVALLRRPQGAGLTELMAATGWQAHSVRGLLSGTIKKKLGLHIIATRDGAQRGYRIEAA